MKSAVQLSYVLLTALVLTVSTAFAQQTLRIAVTDAESGTPLPFAILRLDDAPAVTTDLNGSFHLLLTDKTSRLQVTYPGYLPATITNFPDTFLSIGLQPSGPDNPTTNTADPQEQARALITKAIAAKDSNDPRKRLQTFTFRSYQKSVITIDPDSISGLTDSVYKRKQGLLTLCAIDSGAYRLKQRMSNSHLYVNETAIRVDFDKSKGRKETILGYQMAGLRKNRYRVLTTQLQSFSFYDETYRLERATFKSPLANNAKNTYRYRILDTVNSMGRPAYVLHYYARKGNPDDRMQGVLYLDTTTLALQKGVAQIRGDLQIAAEQVYRYYEDQELWFPSGATLELRKGESKRPVALFDDLLFEVRRSKTGPRYLHTNPDSVDLKVRFVSRLDNDRIELNTPVTITSRTTDIAVDSLSDLRDESFWEDRRTEDLTLRDRVTYLELDSISGARKINKRIAFLNKLFRGYLPTKYVDLDLKYLIKYNNYEAFRTGMGVTTNENFSRRLTLKAYGVYGTKDKDLKYGFDAAYRILKERQSHLGLNYTDDLTETGSAAFITEGRTFYVFEPRLFNITSFHRSKSGSAYFSHEINPSLQFRTQWTQADTRPTYPYAYLQDGKAYTQYQTNTLTVSGYWAPRNRYLVSRDGSTLLEPGWPQFNLQFTKGFRGIMGSDFAFTKLQLRIRQDIHTFGAGSVSLSLNAGYASGQLPITELYHVSPNQPTKDALLQRFSVAGYDSFETMYFDEFFSDRYFSLQAKYLLPRISITGTINPQVVLISRYALGDIVNRQDHLGVPFNSMNKGYYETGLELNNIFSGFGLSTMYRYGPYSLPRPEDNISLKFTFYLSLGI